MTRRARIAISLLATCAVGCDDGIRSLLPDAASPEVKARTWEQVPAPAANYFGVSGSGPNDIVVVGSGGMIARWNGSALVAEDSGTDRDLYGVHVVSPTRAIAAGAQGTVLEWNGTRWVTASVPTTQHLRAAWASESEALVVGEVGTALAKKDGAWQAVSSEIAVDLLAVSNSPDGVFAVGALGMVGWYEGGRLVRRPVRGFNKTLAAATTGAGGTYIAGLDGSLFRHDGSFTVIEGLPSVFVRGVAAPGEDVYVAGWDGFLAKIRGGKVSTYDTVPERWLSGMHANGPSDVWVVGASGLVLHGPPQALADGGLQ